MSNHNQSNDNNENKHSEMDPLGQLNQFHQTTQPNQVNSAQNKTDQQTTASQNSPNKKESPMEIAIEKLIVWWGMLRQSSIMKKLIVHRKLALITSGVVFACLLVLIIGISLSSSSEDLVTEFEKAMIEEDMDTLKDVMVSDHSSIEINDDFVTKLINQGKEDDDFLSDTVSLLHAQKSIYDEKLFEASAYMSDHNLTKQELLNTGNLYIKKEDGWFGTDYVIGVRPVYIKITTSSEPTELKIDGKKINLKKGAREQLYGPILPGKYKIEATKKYPFSLVVDEDEVNLFDKKERTARIHMELEGSTVSFKSQLEGTELFINNQSTKQKVGTRSTEFGPVSTNGTLKAYGQLQLPWGTLKSDPIPIEDSYGGIDITPNPFSSERVKNDIIKVINNYAKEIVTAQVQQNANLFTSLDEKSKKEWANDFADQKEYQSKSYYKGQALKTLIAVKGATLSEGESANVYKVKVPVQFHRRERNYSRFDSGNEPLEEVVKDSYVSLIYNDQSKKWEITSIDSMFFSGDTFKDASVVTTNY